jgi:hypothetical protein
MARDKLDHKRYEEGAPDPFAYCDQGHQHGRGRLSIADLLHQVRRDAVSRIAVVLQEKIRQLRHLFIAQICDVGRLAAEARHERETIRRGTTDAEQNCGDQIAASASGQPRVMEKAGK